VQIKVSRNEFLQCFNLQDDREVEFIVNMDHNNQSGGIQIIKTRETFTVETQILFEVHRLSEAELDFYQMEFNFDPDMLLINAPIRKFRNVKGVFKSKFRHEQLKISFTSKELILTGELNSKITLQISTNDFDNYLNYADLSREMTQDDNFDLTIPLRYVGQALKISEMLDSQFQMAMEMTDDSLSSVYLISEDNQGNFCFSIEAKCIPFVQFKASNFANKKEDDRTPLGNSQEDQNMKKEAKPGYYGDLEPEGEEYEEEKKPLESDGEGEDQQTQEEGEGNKILEKKDTKTEKKSKRAIVTDDEEEEDDVPMKDQKASDEDSDVSMKGEDEEESDENADTRDVEPGNKKFKEKKPKEKSRAEQKRDNFHKEVDEESFF